MAKKILIVDDDAQIRHMLSVRIEGGGYKTIFATNGKEALDIYVDSLAGEKIDLIILDIKMPGVDGREVLNVIRKYEEQRHISEDEAVQIIIVTAVKKSWFDDINHKCDDYIVKPYDGEKLLKKIKDKLGD